MTIDRDNDSKELEERYKNSGAAFAYVYSLQLGKMHSQIKKKNMYTLRSM